MIRFNKILLAASALPGMTAAAPASADVIEVWNGGHRVVAEDARAASAGESAGGDKSASLADEAALASVAPVPVPPHWAAKVAELSRRFDLSPSLIAALVWQESRWQPRAVSPAGARGLAQLMPATARELGVDPDNAEANLEGGARYLRQQLDAFDGDIERALAAYNAGPGRVRRAKGVPAIRETQNYVSAIVNKLADSSGR